MSEGEARLLVVKEMKNGLNFGENYVIEVTASSMGIERSKTKHFGKVEHTRSMLSYLMKL